MEINFSINGIAFSALFPPKVPEMSWNIAITNDIIVSDRTDVTSSFSTDENHCVYYNGQTIQYNGTDVIANAEIIDGGNYTTRATGGVLI